MRRRRNSLLPSSDSYQKHLCGLFCVPNRFFGSRIPANSVQQAMVVLSEPPETTRNAYGTACPTCIRVSSTVVTRVNMYACPPRGWCRKKLPCADPSAIDCQRNPWLLLLDEASAGATSGRLRCPKPINGDGHAAACPPYLRLRHCGHCCRATTCRTKNCQVFMVFAEICWFLATILLMVVQISSCLPTAGKALCRIEVQTCQIANPMSTLLQRSRSSFRT